MRWATTQDEHRFLGRSWVPYPYSIRAMTAFCPVSICPRCGIPTDPSWREGRLFLWCPTPHSFAKLHHALQETALIQSSHSQASSLILWLSQGDVDRFVHCCDQLATPEHRDTKVLFIEGDREPGLEDYPCVSTLDQFLRSIQGQWLTEMLSEGRYTSYFHPIVTAQIPHQIYAHEALFRGLQKNGDLIPPYEIFNLARDTEMLFQLDLAARQSAIYAASHQGLQSDLFINFNPTAIYDPVHCLRSTFAAVESSHLQPHQIVFEIVESDQAKDIEHLKDILRFYRQHGFSVALDDLGSGYGSLNLLHQIRPDFVKLDMQLIRDVHQEIYKGAIVAKILELAQQLGVTTIAEGIETPAELQWLQDHGVDLVQGFLFGKPAPLPKTELPIGA